MKTQRLALASSLMAVSVATSAQDQRSTYAVDFPLRINATAGAVGPTGKAELTLWTNGDSAFGLWRTLDEDSLRFDDLRGRKDTNGIYLHSAARPSYGQTSSGPGSLDIRYEFHITRADDSLHANMTLAVPSAPGMSSPRVKVYGLRLKNR